MVSAVVYQVLIVEKDNDFAILVELANITNSLLTILPPRERMLAIVRSPYQWHHRINFAGMFKKHCVPCGFKFISNCLKHKNDVYEGVEVSQ